MIHNAILTRVQSELIKALYTDIPSTDKARVGYVNGEVVVKLGDLQGEPDPDQARISVTLYENDPDQFITGALTQAQSHWMDEVDMVEVGGATTWKRRFTVKARCLFESTGESLANARLYASTLRTRIEHTLPRIKFGDINADGEYVAMPILTEGILSEMYQSGGPPDSYDFFIKVRFEVLTTTAPIGV
ncbi:MAG TPA: hypothetical protein PKD55_02395 [Bellilinea sp.]|nr:hypothetical protein [Bellilinea sp.]